MGLPLVVTDPALLEGYLCDASNVRGRAEALVRPKTAEEVAARAQHGCPRCLDRATRIATPTGPRPVSALRVGDLVDTVDAGGVADNRGRQG